ncbi:RDD family protein [Actinoplanes sp. NPDC051851]|uniref:RDD family protein n=1 Tax=Actinoplanes sp. NPDC051851 TaxID=3154753 RepID=UPI003429BC6E
MTAPAPTSGPAPSAFPAPSGLVGTDGPATASGSGSSAYGSFASGSLASGSLASGFVTAEAVALELRPARLGSRAIALMIDVMVQAVVAMILVALTGILWPLIPSVLVDEALLDTVIRVVTVLVLLLYPAYVETRTNGRSPGKSAMGLRVIREDGGPIRPRHAFTRALIGLAVEWPGLLMLPLTWAGSLATMLFSDKGRRLGDLAAGTLVIHERRPSGFRYVPPMPPELAPWAATTDLSTVDDELAEAVRQFLSRHTDLHEPHRSQLLRSLAAEVGTRVTPPAPPGVAPLPFLTAVLAERRRRSAAQLVNGRLVSERLLPGFGQTRPYLVRRDPGVLPPSPHPRPPAPPSVPPPPPAAPFPAAPGTAPLRPQTPSTDDSPAPG